MVFFPAMTSSFSFGLGSGLYDVLDIKGSAIFTGGNIEFDFINGFKPSKGDSWDFLFADTITGWETLSFILVGLDSGFDWKIDPFTNGEIFGERLLIMTAPVPLPGSILLLGSGLLGLVGWRRLRKG